MKFFKERFYTWKFGLFCLFDDETFSFYMFSTIIFAECFYACTAFENPMKLIFVLLGYVFAIFIFSFLKGCAEGLILEPVFSVLYVFSIIALFIVGCTFNVLACIIMTLIPIAWVILSLFIKDLQPFNIKSVKRAKIATAISDGVIYLVPIIAFIVTFAMIPEAPVILKFIVPIIYIALCPVIAYYEDSSATCNIFELAYDITFSKDDFEDFKKFLKERKDKKNSK